MKFIANWFGWFVAVTFASMMLCSLWQLCEWISKRPYGTFVAVLFLLLVISFLLAYFVKNGSKEADKSA